MLPVIHGYPCSRVLPVLRGLQRGSGLSVWQKKSWCQTKETALGSRKPWGNAPWLRLVLAGPPRPADHGPAPMTDCAEAQPAKTPTPAERVTTLRSGAARARQGRGLSGRVGDVAAQGRSEAEALPHTQPDRAAVGLLTKQTLSEEHWCCGRLATGGVLPGAKRAHRASGGVETGLPPGRPAIAGLETWQTLSARRR